jgi:hypothetical protein
MLCSTKGIRSLRKKVFKAFSCEPRRTRSADAPVTTALTSFDDIREIAHRLPGVVDGSSYGTPALKVGGKLLARLHQSMDCVVLRSDLLDREILLQSAPDAFFITDHYRDYPWILVRLGVVEKRALPDLIERAWRLVASKTLIKKYDGGR